MNETRGKLELRRLGSVSEFAEHAAAWDDLVRAMARPSPFLHTAWLVPWWMHYGSETPMHIEAALLDGRLAGGVPIEIERQLGLRIARFMGRDHSALGDILASADHADEIVPSLIDRVRDVGVDYVHLFGLASQGRLFDAVDRKQAALVERVEAPVLDLRPGWAEIYRERTSSKRRNLHRRRRRQLEALGELELVLLRDEEELVGALDDAFRIHDLRWKGRPDRSDFTTRIGREFNVDALRQFARAGLARILMLRIGGKAVAFQYYLLFERRMFFYRLAFDPAYARFSPGLLTTLEAIELAAAEGAERVEFLGGGERYKLELADANEPLYECIGYGSSIRGRISGTAARLWVDTRLRLKRSERLQRVYARAGRRRKGTTGVD